MESPNFGAPVLNTLFREVHTDKHDAPSGRLFAKRERSGRDRLDSSVVARCIMDPGRVKGNETETR